MKIILSNTSKGALTGVVSDLKSKHKDAHHIFLVPDRFTASYEKEILRALDIDSTFNIEVMSFSRFAEQTIGSDIKKCLTPEGSVMLMSKAIVALGDRLNYYFNVANIDGFRNEIYATITSLRNSGVSVDDFRHNTHDLTGIMRAKSDDIALIYGEYLSLLQENFSDASTRLEYLADYLKKSDAIPVHFYSVGFYNYKAPEYAIMKGLSAKALSLTVGIMFSSTSNNARIYPNHIFSKLKSLTSDKVDVDLSYEKFSSPTNLVAGNLFSYESEEKAENNGKYQLKTFKDIDSEVEMLALSILQNIKSGERFFDQEVYLADLPLYEQAIKTAFLKYNIPFFIDQKASLEEQALPRFILSLISIKTSNLGRQEVSDFVKNPLFGLMFKSYIAGEIEKLDHDLSLTETEIEYQKSNAVFLFDNFMLTKKIEHSRFRQKMYEMSEREITKDSPALWFLDKQRQFMLSFVDKFDKINDEYSHFANIIADIVLMVKPAWDSYAETLSAISLYYKKCSEQVEDKIFKILAEIENVLDKFDSLKEFQNILKSMFASGSIALVPTFLDSVFVGSTESRFSGHGNLFVLGAGSGNFPSHATRNSVIGYQEELILLKAGIEICPNEKQKNYEKMLKILDIFVSVKGKIWISHTLAGSDRSAVMQELQNLLLENGEQIKIEKYEPQSMLFDSDNDIILDNMFSTEKACFEKVLSNFTLPNPKLVDTELLSTVSAFLNPKSRAMLDRVGTVPEYAKTENIAHSKISASKIENFYACPYSHFIKYHLGLRMRDLGEPSKYEIGLILHSVLEQLYKDLVRFDGVLENVDALAEKYFDRAIKDLKIEFLLLDKSYFRSIAKTKREAVAICKSVLEIYKHTDFKPILIEGKIGINTKPYVLKNGENEIVLTGTIDRVDSDGKNFIVVDYKTFKSASIDYKSIYYGEKVQLYLYMNAVKSSFDLSPKGAYYLPIFSNFVGEDEKRFKYTGHSTDDLAVLEKIDHRINSDSKNATVEVKNGRGAGTLSETYHCSDKQFLNISNYVGKILSEGQKSIDNGFIKPVPIANACDRCDYAEFCNYRSQQVREHGSVKLSVFDL